MPLRAGGASMQVLGLLVVFATEPGGRAGSPVAESARNVLRTDDGRRDGQESQLNCPAFAYRRSSAVSEIRVAMEARAREVGQEPSCCRLTARPLPRAGAKCAGCGAEPHGVTSGAKSRLLLVDP